ncbi:MAG: hypothetical protein SFW62_09760 [Alphaproteobacteria bacterium]|nr:hypothetical protein [Alphaproteobacteria bacterium]
MNEPISGDSIRTELATLQNYVSAALDVMKSGHMPDMAGLEDRVTVICDTIQKAPRNIQQECLPELLNFLQRLNECEARMRSLHESTQKQGGTP